MRGLILLAALALSACANISPAEQAEACQNLLKLQAEAISSGASQSWLDSIASAISLACVPA